jgi:hypothetical protein
LVDSRNAGAGRRGETALMCEYLVRVLLAVQAAEKG